MKKFASQFKPVSLLRYEDGNGNAIVRPANGRKVFHAYYQGELVERSGKAIEYRTMEGAAKYLIG